MKKGILFVVIALMAVFAAGCFHNSSGAPTDFGEQGALAKDNFLKGCTNSNLSVEAIEDQRELRFKSCVCAYKGISQDIDFEDFQNFNNQLKDNPALLSNTPDPNTVHADIALIRSGCMSACSPGGNCRAPRISSRNN